jgi:hypothetical protein
MDLRHLCPYYEFVVWDEKPIKLRPFDLRAITWAERFFFKEEKSGLSRMYEILKADTTDTLFQNTVIDIVYHLGETGFVNCGFDDVSELKLALANDNKMLSIVDSAIETVSDYLKSCDGVKEDSLLKEINKSIDYRNKIRNTALIKIMEFTKAVENVLKSSFPKPKKKEEPKGGSIFEALRAQSKKVESKTEEYWEQIYSKFFIYGKLTIDQFYSLTMRQIDILSKEIRYLRQEDFNILSELIHKKMMIKSPVRSFEEIELDEKDQAEFKKMYDHMVKNLGVH